MTNIRPTLDIIWDKLRKASVTDDLVIIEYIAALLTEDHPWLFNESQKPAKPRTRYNPDDTALKNQLIDAASQINKTNRQQGLADLFNRQVLFYSSKYKGQGVYPTPRHIVDFMMNLLQTQPEHDFADLTCGSGGFLVRRFHQERTSKRRRVPKVPPPGILGQTIGIEHAPEWTRLAHTNLLLHDIPADKVHIYTGDVLRLSGAGGDLENTYFDRIALSPPLDIPVSFPTQIFPLGLSEWNPDTVDSDNLFTYLMYRKLRNDGKGICIVSTSTVTRYSRKTQALRKIVIEAKAVEAVIELNHDSLSPFTQEQAYILMLHKHIQQSPWFLRVERDGYNTGPYRDLMLEPHFSPAFNDMPFIQQVVNLTKDTLGGVRSGGITYHLIHFEKRIAGIIIKTEDNAKITRIIYQQGITISQLNIEVLHNEIIEQTSVDLSIQPLSNPHSSRTVFRNGKPNQMLAISYDGRLLGVTASVQEIIDNKYDLLPTTYMDTDMLVDKTVEHIPDTQDVLESAILDHDPALIVSQLPLIADHLADIEPILGAKQQAIWHTIKQLYSTEQYALPFTADELTSTSKFPRQDVTTTLRLLERFGLITCVQMNDEGDDSSPNYYRRVTNADVVGGLIKNKKP